MVGLLLGTLWLWATGVMAQELSAPSQDIQSQAGAAPAEPVLVLPQEDLLSPAAPLSPGQTVPQLEELLRELTPPASKTPTPPVYTYSPHEKCLYECYKKWEQRRDECKDADGENAQKQCIEANEEAYQQCTHGYCSELWNETCMDAYMSALKACQEFSAMSIRVDCQKGATLKLGGCLKKEVRGD